LTNFYTPLKKNSNPIENFGEIAYDEENNLCQNPGDQMKKIIALIAILTSLNSFATAQWGSIKCNEVSSDELILMDKVMSNVEVNEKNMIKKVVGPMFAEKFDQKDRIEQLDFQNALLELNRKVIDHRLSFLKFSTDCLDEKIGR
jgi:hypothetical protein